MLKAGDTLLEIVPSQDRLIVEARINPVDIDNVAVGQASRPLGSDHDEVEQVVDVLEAVFDGNPGHGISTC